MDPSFGGFSFGISLSGKDIKYREAQSLVRPASEDLQGTLVWEGCSQNNKSVESDPEAG